MTTLVRQRLILAAVAVIFAWPVASLVIAVLFAPAPGLFLPIGGRVEPDDDLLPAADPAFAPALHARYTIYIQQKTRGSGEVDLTLVAPAALPPRPAALPALACRVAAWMARQALPVQPVTLTIRLEAAAEPGAATVPIASCDPAGPAARPGG